MAKQKDQTIEPKHPAGNQSAPNTESPSSTQNSLTVDTTKHISEWIVARLGQVKNGEWSEETQAWAEDWAGRKSLQYSDGDEMAPPIVLGELFSWLVDVHYGSFRECNPVAPKHGEKRHPVNDGLSWDPLPDQQSGHYELILRPEGGTNQEAKRISVDKSDTEYKRDALSPNTVYWWSMFQLMPKGNGIARRPIFSVRFKTDQ